MLRWDKCYPPVLSAGEEHDHSVPVRDDRKERRARRKEQDVLLEVSELEVEKITLEVGRLRAHVSVLAQLANLVNLQVGVDARLSRVKLVIEGVRAKVLLKVWLDEVRAILEKALDTLGQHPEILENLLKTLNELMVGRLGDALQRVALILTRTHHACTIGRVNFSAEPSVRLMRYGSITLKSAVGALENVLEGLEEGDTVDALLKGRLENTRAILEQLVEQVGVEGATPGGLGDRPTNATEESTQEEQ